MSGGELTPALLSIVDPVGTHTAVALDFAWPNGIGLAPDESVLYVADFDQGVIHASPWRPGEQAAAGIALEPWATSPTNDADGLVVSADGTLWVAGGAGGVVLHFDASGRLLDQLDVPDDFVSSCTYWPDPDHLAITTGTAVFVHQLR
jgi:gluconolactonase